MSTPNKTLVPRAPIIVVHGGAWAMPDATMDAHRNGVRNAAQAGWMVLARGGSALDAVEEALVIMEDDEIFDAGRGSFLTRDGRVQLDALMMDGATMKAGGVGCVERLRNPIRASRLVLDKSPHVYFVGEGAERFAQEHGMELCRNEDLVIERERRRLKEAQCKAAAGKKDTTFAGDSTGRISLDISSNVSLNDDGCDTGSSDVNDSPGIDSHDTVGAVALDAGGNLAGATSTGGTLNKAPGRVGDSSLIGCGCYADNQSAAVSCTGWGEPIMKLVLGKWAADRVGEGRDPGEVAVAAIDYLGARLQGRGGMILLDVHGRFGIAHNTPRMAWGIHRESGIEVGITRNG